MKHFSRGALAGSTIAVSLISALLLAPGPARAQSPSCQLCVSFVTTFDPDGSGVAKAKTRMHHDLVANLPYALDVDGDLSPAPLPVLSVLPGYEVSAEVRATDALTPKITIKKLLGTPTTMPLRIELVRGNSAGWKSLGYDTLASSAPGAFTANADLTDRDGDPHTEQAALDATITDPPTGTGRPLTLVTESFGGDPAGARTNRAITRLGYAAQGTGGRIPGRVTADVTSPSDAQGAPDRRRVVLTRNAGAETRLDFEVTTPEKTQNAQTVPATTTTGHMATLPQRIDLTLSAAVEGIDVNRDGQADFEADVNRIDYAHATSVAHDVVIDSRSGQDVTHAEIVDLPTDAHLTYASPRDASDPDAETRVTYHADGRATRAEVLSDNGSRRLTASLTNVPLNIDRLSFADDSTCKSGLPPKCSERGHVVYDTDGIADEATIDIAEGVRRTHAELQKVPFDLDLKYSTTDDSGEIHYAATGVADHANVDITDESEKRFQVDLDDFPATTDFHYEKTEVTDEGKRLLRGLKLTYRASSDVPTARVDATNLGGQADSTKNVHLNMTGVPVNLDFALRKEETVEKFDIQVPPPASQNCSNIPPPEHCLKKHFDRVTRTNAIFKVVADTPFIPGRPPERTLGSLEFQMASGDEVPLPAALPNGRLLNGLRLRDVPGDKSLFARGTDFDSLVFQRTLAQEKREGDFNPYFKSDKQTSVNLDSDADDRAFALDMQQGSGQVVTTKAELASIPPALRLNLIDHDDEFDHLSKSTVDYRAGDQVDGYVFGATRHPGFDFVETTKSGSADEVITKRASIDPMPGHLSTCQQAAWHDCSNGVFDANIIRLRDGDYPLEDWACLDVGGVCGGREIPISPAGPSSGSVEILAEDVDQPVDLVYETRPLSGTDLTAVNLKDFYAFRLQGDYGINPCPVSGADCPVGYIAMDTGGGPLEGSITTHGSDQTTELTFAPGFEADRHVWGFHGVGFKQGESAIAGPINCPLPGTKIVVAGNTHTEKFCFGQLTEWNF